MEAIARPGAGEEHTTSALDVWQLCLGQVGRRAAATQPQQSRQTILRTDSWPEGASLSRRQRIRKPTESLLCRWIWARALQTSRLAPEQAVL